MNFKQWGGSLVFAGKVGVSFNTIIINRIHKTLPEASIFLWKIDNTVLCTIYMASGKLIYLCGLHLGLIDMSPMGCCGMK